MQEVGVFVSYSPSFSVGLTEGGLMLSVNLNKNEFNVDLKASTDPASLICLGRLFHKNGARETNALLPADLLVDGMGGMQGSMGGEAQTSTKVPIHLVT